MRPPTDGSSPPLLVYILAGIMLGLVVSLALFSASDHASTAAAIARRPLDTACPRDLSAVGWYTDPKAAQRTDMLLCAHLRKGEHAPAPLPRYDSEAAAIKGAAAAGYRLVTPPATLPSAPVHAGLDPWIPDPSATFSPHRRTLTAAHGHAVAVCDIACARRAHAGRGPNVTIELPERGSAPLYLYSDDLVPRSSREIAAHPSGAPEVHFRAAYCRNVPVGPIVVDNRGRTWFTDPVWGRQQFRFC